MLLSFKKTIKIRKNVKRPYWWNEELKKQNKNSIYIKRNISKEILFKTTVDWRKQNYSLTKLKIKHRKTGLINASYHLKVHVHPKRQEDRKYSVTFSRCRWNTCI